METKNKFTAYRMTIFTILLSITILLGIILSFIPKTQSDQRGVGSLAFTGGKQAVQVINIFNVIEYQSTVPNVISGLNIAKESKSIKGVILRINSGGGTVGASQEIYRRILQFRKETKKPVIAVFGDIAASGAYYIACATDKIYARPGTLTGSIGVIMGGFTFKKLFDTLGIKQEIIKSGKFKDLGSAIGRDRTPEEIQLLTRLIQETYRQFFNAVLTGRKGKISKAKLEKIADGRVFNGENAKKLGLIDHIGGPREALDMIKKMMRLKGKVYLLERQQSPLNKLMKILGANKSLSMSEFMKQYSSNTPLYLYSGK